MFDTHGVPVWWKSTPIPPSDLTLLPNGDFAWARAYTLLDRPDDPAAAYEQRSLDGALIRTFSTVGTATDPHDLQSLPGGNRLLLSYRPRDGVDLTAWGGPRNATVLDAEVQEITTDGQLVWSWNSQDHVGLAETGHWFADTVIPAPTVLSNGRKAYDIVHINSVEPDGEGIVVSLRHTDAVYRIRRATGAVDWKLGGTPTPASLAVLADINAATTFGGQHDARVLPDGTLTLHDNGTGRRRQPRAVRYALDPLSRTATLLESVSETAATTSACCGGARRLPTGGWVTAWGGTPHITEVDPSGRSVFHLTITEGGLFSYRGEPVLPGRIARTSLRAGMDAMHPR